MLRMCHRFDYCRTCTLGEYFECEFCELFNDNAFNEVYYCTAHHKYLEPVKNSYEVKL